MKSRFLLSLCLFGLTAGIGCVQDEVSPMDTCATAAESVSCCDVDPVTASEGKYVGMAVCEDEVWQCDVGTVCACDPAAPKPRCAAGCGADGLLQGHCIDGMWACPASWVDIDEDC